MTRLTDRLSPEEVHITSGGLQIFARIWRPSTPPRAILAICHGLNSHSGQYAWVAEQMVAAGLSVYALDLRGRGRSEGDRFFAGSIDDYVSDLSALIRLARVREPGLPVYLLGHSAGGVTSCVYALENQSQLAGLICESFAFQVPAPDIALAVIKGVSRIAPHARVLRLRNADFSRDPEVVKALNDDPLIAGESQPCQTVASLIRADERLKREFPLITLPVLILHGTADKATRPSGSRFFHETAGSTDKSLRLYDGHYHDLLSDLGKEEVMADIRDWIEARLPMA
ncbi:alpha/beta hydrolase [Paroceanicella profunda]|uniref:Alpha/beta hydrolase n=1 Tax=Paroceanicella profunda TaxID=2579971 RepID=A0A5B8FY73_9RHOB|nr:alpha/beta hydrolase [Paroceanicella profunda]QDL91093.1 alpha/beta hydrolase [Paroceanicella profunda]